jgi:hypothetical protein
VVALITPWLEIANRLAVAGQVGRMGRLVVSGVVSRSDRFGSGHDDSLSSLEIELDPVGQSVTCPRALVRCLGGQDERPP